MDEAESIEELNEDRKYFIQAAVVRFVLPLSIHPQLADHGGGI